MDTPSAVRPHPTERILEEYIFDRLAPLDVAIVEEHLLVCSYCQTVLEELDEYVLLLKAATAEYRNTGAEVQTKATGGWEALSSGLRMPGLRMPSRGTLAVTAALVVLVAVTLDVVPKSWRSTSARTPTTVSLVALRGGSDSAENFAPSSAPLNFSIDTSDLPDAGTYRIEIVDLEGRPVWSREAPPSQGKILTHLEQSPKPGLYWVRLYTAREGKAGELAREFGLRLE